MYNINLIGRNNVILINNKDHTLIKDIKSMDNNDILNIVGDKGPIGDKGPTGDKGTIGDQGPTGDKGPIGDKGAVGAQGPQGSVQPVNSLRNLPSNNKNIVLLG